MSILRGIRKGLIGRGDAGQKLRAAMTRKLTPEEQAAKERADAVLREMQEKIEGIKP